ncbi:pantoate--beta-alanine ligase [Candidatus Omnitrophota bacterium]
MKVIRTVKEMQRWAQNAHRKGKSIGLVPTMGYLHPGHISLIRKAGQENDYLVISIFVNPTQFGPKEDFKRYPRDFSRDKKLAKLNGVDILFYPQVKDIYPPGFRTNVRVEDLSLRLCGAKRPGHFSGVATIVLKLLNICRAQRTYFGQKDAQQAIIIKRMVSDLNVPTEILIAPIVRQKNGLAFSSRNIYLNKQQKKNAAILYKALQTAVDMIKSGEKAPRGIINKISRIIKATPGARIDYIKIVDLDSLETAQTLQRAQLIALAVFFGQTRLIDNVIVPDPRR